MMRRLMMVLFVLLPFVVFLNGCKEKESETPIRKSLVEESRDRIDPDAPVDTSAEHFERAMWFMEHGSFDRAHVQFYKAIEKDPRNAGAHNGLGYTYANVHQNMIMAQYHWEKTLEYGGNRAQETSAHFGLGIVYSKRGLRRSEEEKNPDLEHSRHKPEEIKVLRSSFAYFDMAEDHFLKVLQLDSGNVEVQYELATLELARGRYEEALIRYRNYVQKFGPTDMKAIRKAYRGIAVTQEAQGKLFQAIESLKLVMKTYPEYGGTRADDKSRLQVRLEIDRLETKIIRGSMDR